MDTVGIIRANGVAVVIPHSRTGPRCRHPLHAMRAAPMPRPRATGGNSHPPVCALPVRDTFIHYRSNMYLESLRIH